MRASLGSRSTHALASSIPWLRPVCPRGRIQTLTKFTSALVIPTSSSENAALLRPSTPNRALGRTGISRKVQVTGTISEVTCADQRYIICWCALLRSRGRMQTRTKSTSALVIPTSSSENAALLRPSTPNRALGRTGISRKVQVTGTISEVTRADQRHLNTQIRLNRLLSLWL